MKALMIIVAHGRLPQGFESACGLIMGPSAKLVGVSLTAETRIEDLVASVTGAARRADRSAPILLLTDLLGGATTQAALRVQASCINVHLVASANLGLLLELALAEFSAEPAGHEANRALIDAAILRARESMQMLDVPAEIDGATNPDDSEL